MSKKDVDKYYTQICTQYRQILDTIKALEKEASEGMVDPDRVEAVKASMRPFMDNYQRISYIMYLFNMPERKSKIPEYERRNKNLLKKIDKKNTTDATIAECQAVVDKVKSI